MKNKLIKVGTFFSGIGSPEKALQKLKDENIINDYNIEFFSEIDKFAIKSYCAIHNIDEKLNLGDITKIKGNDLPYCDLWIGGFPCQDISNLSFGFLQIFLFYYDQKNYKFNILENF